MFDLNALRGISKPAPVQADPLPQKIKTEAEIKKEKRKQELIDKGIERARPDLKGPQKEKAKEILVQKVDNERLPLDPDMEDLAFSIAESLQRIEDELSPETEYLDWIEESQEVIHDMTNGDITEEDLDKREDFLEDMDQREIDIKLYISLYQASKSPKAKEKLEFLQKKLAKLQEVRAAVIASTKSREEAELNNLVNEEERRIAAEYQRMLEERKRKEDDSLYSDAEYKAGLLMAQTLIAMALLEEREKENQLRKQRYQEYLRRRAEEMKGLNKIAPDSGLASFFSKHIEMMNLVKTANTSAQQGQFTEEEQIRRDICGAVLEYRRRDKAVPDKILCKLGVKSFVPEYSMGEEMLAKKTQHETKEDVLKRINELSGRQSSSGTARLSRPQKIQSFDMQRYIALRSRECA